ncbi:hypothetical protein [Paraburkholderia strydomiana]|uniref:hypothetical protein n=1 Tax=Paraburkholderia strydomiana TaxID=1245417 RepID=UPI0038B8C58A
MQFSDIRRILSNLIPHLERSPAASPLPPEPSQPSALEFDPMWHGDHWQNLLSSPMDARRYVMEDWTATTADEWRADRAASAH